MSDLVRLIRRAMGDYAGEMSEAQLVYEISQAHGKAKKWDEWAEVQNEVEAEMPEGWSVELRMSPGDWDICLFDPDHSSVSFDRDCDTTAQTIRSAIDHAIEAASKVGGNG